MLKMAFLTEMTDKIWKILSFSLSTRGEYPPLGSELGGSEPGSPSPLAETLL